MKNIVEIRNLKKEYKLFKNEKARLIGSLLPKLAKHKVKKALDIKELNIKAGETVAILGKNGAGKSTFMKVMTGVTHPTSGLCNIDGKVGALLELTAGFNADFTGRENIHLKCMLLGLDKKESKKIEQSIIDFSEIEEYIDQPLRTYSSGMKARLAFAIHINIIPDLLIVDEALSVGDKAFRDKCHKKVDSLIKKGLTLILITHSEAQAKLFCKRGIVMKAGKVTFDGTIDQALTNYNKK